MKKELNHPRNAKHSKTGLSGVVFNLIKYMLVAIAIIIAIIALIFGESKMLLTQKSENEIVFNVMYYRNEQTGEIFYSLADAIENVEELEEEDPTATYTIQVLNNKTETQSVTVSAGTNLILDLNGKTLSFNISGESLENGIVNNGNLIITDSTEEENATNEVNYTLADGTKPKYAGKITSNKRVADNIGTLEISGKVCVENNSSGYSLIFNKGELTINDGVLRAINYKGIGNGYPYRADNTKLEINGGILISKNILINNDSEDNESVIINGGTLESNTGAYTICNNSTGTIEIKGGNIESRTAEGIYQNLAGTIIIGNNEDEVTADTPIIKGATKGADILDGTFNFYDGQITAPTNNSLNKEPDAIPDGYAKIIVDNQDGTETAKLSKIYNVTADANGGIIPETEGWTVAQGSATATKDVIYETPYGTLPEPTREGYTFQGWHGKNLFNINNKPAGNTTYMSPGVTIQQGDWITIDTSNGNVFYNFWTRNLDVEKNKNYTVVIETKDAENLTGDFYYTSTYSNDGQFDAYMIHANTFSANSVLVRTIATRQIADVTGNCGLRTFYHNVNRNTDEKITFRISVLEYDSSITADNFKYEPYYITDTTNVAQAQNHTLTAVWTPNTYTVTADANGGTIPATQDWTVASGSATATKDVTYNATYGTLPTPTRTGYTFQGWNGKNIINIDKAVNDSLIYNGDGTYTMWYNDKGRMANSLYVSIPENTVLKMSYDLVDYNGTYDSPLQIWGRYVGGETFYIGSSGNGRISLTKELFSLTLYQEGSQPVGTYTKFKNLQLEVGIAATPYEPYYINDSIPVTQSKNHTIKAIWKANDYKLTLNNQGANTTGTEEVYYKYNTATYYSDQVKTTTISSITIPTKTGYTFSGYYTEQNGQGTQYITADGQFTGNPYLIGEDTTLYAYWTPNQYTVTADANGGTIPATTGWTVAAGDATATKSVTYNAAYGTLPTPTRVGYTFQGWNGKNIFDFSKWLTLCPGIVGGTMQKTEDSITITANADSGAYTNTYYATENGAGNPNSLRIPVKPSTRYTVSWETVQNIESKIFVFINDKNEVRFRGVNGKFSFTTTADAQYISLRCDVSTQGNTITYKNIQIEEGSEATTYEPYYVTSETTVAQAQNHTLTAKWSTNAGKYVDIGTNILDLQNTTLSDNTHPAADWRVFSQDANGTWLMLADYMPNSAFDVTDVGLEAATGNYATYGVRSTANRATLIDGLNGTIANQSDWSGLISKSSVYGKTGVEIKGAIDLETWVKSWNENSTQTLYTTTTAEPMSDGLNGYYVGNTENPTTSSYQVSNSNKTLYFPQTSVISNNNGYWLATPSASGANYVRGVNYDGIVHYNDYNGSGYGVRPVVYIPNWIKLDTTSAVWTVEDVLQLDNQSATTAGTEEVYYTQNTATYYSDEAKTTTISSITIPTKTGYTFGGYYTEPNGQGTQYITENGEFTGNPYTLKGIKRLYAHWVELKITVTINKDDVAWADSGMKIDLSTSDVSNTATFTETVSTGSVAEFSGLTNGTTYYIYAGKHDADKTNMVNTGLTAVTGDSVDVDYYTIDRNQGAGTTLVTSFDSSSGSAFSVTRQVLKDVTIYARASIDSGYSGTATLMHGNTSMTASGDTFVVSDAETITSAGATANTYYIVLNTNYSSTTNTNSELQVKQTMRYGTPAKLLANTFTNYGYVFKEWNTEPDGSGTSYADEEEVNNLTTVNNATVKLYAQWKIPPIKYAVQIYGINQDVDANDQTLGLTFGPATEENVADKYITHTYRDNNDGTYTLVQQIYTVGNDTPAESDLNVTRTSAQIEQYGKKIHDMSWTDIAAEPNKEVFTDSMLCGDTKSVEINLNDTIKTANYSIQTMSGDGCGILFGQIVPGYGNWNASANNDRKNYGYKGSRIRSTLIGYVSGETSRYAGTCLTETNCLYSCIESDVQDVITAKKIKYVTGTSATSFQAKSDISDKIWLFSAREIMGTGSNCGNNAEGLGSSGVGYAKFTNLDSKYYISSYKNSASSLRMSHYSLNDNGGNYLLRSINLTNDRYVGSNYGQGSVSVFGQTYNSNGGPGIAFGFCIK